MKRLMPLALRGPHVVRPGEEVTLVGCSEVPISIEGFVGRALVTAPLLRYYTRGVGGSARRGRAASARWAADALSARRGWPMALDVVAVTFAHRHALTAPVPLHLLVGARLAWPRLHAGWGLRVVLRSREVSRDVLLGLGAVGWTR